MEQLKHLLSNCTLCPRNCGVNRLDHQIGYCGEPAEIFAARAALHMWEEPCLIGETGSGTVFFSGCNLKCVFCQNHNIAIGQTGKAITISRLSEIFLELQQKGAANINLVTPTHYIPQIRLALLKAKEQGLSLPVVYNTGGYEKPEVIKKIANHVSVFLVDIKYFSSELSTKYSKCKDYYEYAKASFKEMLQAKPNCVFDENGIMTSGVILRHLVLPSCRRDSISILEDIAKSFDVSSFKLSLMSQYTPDFCPDDFPELKRRLTSFEYDSVVDYALSLGYDGYIQDKSSATADYTPNFK